MPLKKSNPFCRNDFRNTVCSPILLAANYMGPTSRSDNVSASIKCQYWDMICKDLWKASEKSCIYVPDTATLWFQQQCNLRKTDDCASTVLPRLDSAFKKDLESDCVNNTRNKIVQLQSDAGDGHSSIKHLKLKKRPTKAKIFLPKSVYRRCKNDLHQSFLGNTPKPSSTIQEKTKIIRSYKKQEEAQGNLKYKKSLMKPKGLERKKLHKPMQLIWTKPDTANLFDSDLSVDHDPKKYPQEDNKTKIKSGTAFPKKSKTSMNKLGRQSKSKFNLKTLKKTANKKLNVKSNSLSSANDHSGHDNYNNRKANNLKIISRNSLKILRKTRRTETESTQSEIKKGDKASQNNNTKLNNKTKQKVSINILFPKRKRMSQTTNEKIYVKCNGRRSKETTDSKKTKSTQFLNTNMLLLNENKSSEIKDAIGVTLPPKMNKQLGIIKKNVSNKIHEGLSNTDRRGVKAKRPFLKKAIKPKRNPKNFVENHARISSNASFHEQSHMNTSECDKLNYWITDGPSGEYVEQPICNGKK